MASASRRHRGGGVWGARLAWLAAFGVLSVPAMWARAAADAAGNSRTARLIVDFAGMSPGGLPAGFRSALNGSGPPPVWKIEQVDPVTGEPPAAGGATRRIIETIVAQDSRDPTDERFPLLIYEPVLFGDFTAHLKFRTVSGARERMAGLAFRLQDETNYYVLRASSLGNTFRFYKVVDGVRSNPIGPSVPIPSGAWHTLDVTCRGNTIVCGMDGKDLIPPLKDTSFARGHLAFWTKSDSVSQFGRLDVEYDVVQTLPERLVERALDRYPRLKAVTILGRRDGAVATLASSDPAYGAEKPSDADLQALDGGQISVGVASDHAAAVFPLRDRNGNPLFALRLKMRTFPGQTQGNIAARARIVADFLQDIVSSEDRDRGGE